MFDRSESGWLRDPRRLCWGSQPFWTRAWRTRWTWPWPRSISSLPSNSAQTKLRMWRGVWTGRLLSATDLAAELLATEVFVISEFLNYLSCSFALVRSDRFSVAKFSMKRGWRVSWSFHRKLGNHVVSGSDKWLNSKFKWFQYSDAADVKCCTY